MGQMGEKMKRILSTLLAGAMVVSLCACSSSTSKDNNSSTAQTEQASGETKGIMPAISKDKIKGIPV